MSSLSFADTFEFYQEFFTILKKPISKRGWGSTIGTTKCRTTDFRNSEISNVNVKKGELFDISFSIIFYLFKLFEHSKCITIYGMKIFGIFIVF